MWIRSACPADACYRTVGYVGYNNLCCVLEHIGDW